MRSSLLIETISLLKEIHSRKSNTRSCVVRNLDKTIGNLESLKRERYSEPELATLILQELDVLFTSFPEISNLFDKLSE